MEDDSKLRRTAGFMRSNQKNVALAEALQKNDEAELRRISEEAVADPLFVSYQARLTDVGGTHMDTLSIKATPSKGSKKSADQRVTRSAGKRYPKAPNDGGDEDKEEKELYAAGEDSSNESAMDKAREEALKYKLLKRSRQKKTDATAGTTKAFRNPAWAFSSEIAAQDDVYATEKIETLRSSSDEYNPNRLRAQNNAVADLIFSSKPGEKIPVPPESPLESPFNGEAPEQKREWEPGAKAPQVIEAIISGARTSGGLQAHAKKRKVAVSTKRGASIEEIYANDATGEEDTEENAPRIKREAEERERLAPYNVQEKKNPLEPEEKARAELKRVLERGMPLPWQNFYFRENNPEPHQKSSAPADVMEMLEGRALNFLGQGGNPVSLHWLALRNKAVKVPQGGAPRRRTGPDSEREMVECYQKATPRVRKVDDEFLRQAVGVERPCLSGDLCMARFIPNSIPVTLREMTTVEDLEYWTRNNQRWPEHVKPCLMCDRYCRQVLVQSLQMNNEEMEPKTYVQNYYNLMDVEGEYCACDFYMGDDDRHNGLFSPTLMHVAFQYTQKYDAELGVFRFIQTGYAKPEEYYEGFPRSAPPKAAEWSTNTVGQNEGRDFQMRPPARVAST